MTKLMNSCQGNQGYQKKWSAQRILKIVKHSSRSLLQNTTVDCSYNLVRETSTTFGPSENVETQKLSHTEGRKITPTLTKCPGPVQTHYKKHGSFHIPRCAVTAGVPKTLPLYATRADSPIRRAPSVLACGPRSWTGRIPVAICSNNV